MRVEEKQMRRNKIRLERAIQKQGGKIGPDNSSLVKVLLIQEDRLEAQRIRSMLAEFGGRRFELEYTDRLSRGLKHLAQGGIDIILLNPPLPDGEGLDTLLEVRAKAPALPIVVLTDLDDGALAVEALKAGAQDYLPKSRLNGDLLVRAIRDAMERHQFQAKLIHRSQELLQAAPDAIIITDHEGRIALINRQAEKLFGYDREALLGKPVEMLVPEPLREAHIQHRAAYYSSPRAQSMSRAFSDIAGRRKDGKLVPVEISLSPLKTEEGIFVISAVRDVTATKRLQSTLRESQRTLLTLMGNLPGMAYRCRNDKDWTFEFASDGCFNLTGYKPEDLIQSRAISYGQLIHPEDRDQVWDDVQAALEKKRPFELTYRIATATGAQKWVWERGIGVFSPEEPLEALEGFITDITKRKEAEESLERHAREIEALYDISQTVINSIELKDIADGILGKVLEIGRFDIGVIRLLEPSNKSLLPIASRGYRHPEKIRAMQMGQKGPTRGASQAQVLASRGAFVCENVLSSEGFRTFKKEGVESLIVVPAQTGDEVLGTIQVGSRTPRKFQPEEIRLLKAIGNQLGVGAQKSRFHEATQKNQERLRALHEIDKAITSTLDLRIILDILLEKIDLFLPYGAATVRLVDKKSGLLEPVACRNVDEKAWKDGRWTGGRGLASVVFKNNAPVIVKNVQNDPRVQDMDFHRKHQLTSYLGVPLIVKDEPLGVLNFYTKKEHEFSQEQVELLATLAGQAAVAIYNARLYEETKMSQRTLELTNQQLQKSLRELSGLYAALTPLTPTESVNQMMNSIVERLMETTGADAALVRLQDAATESLSCVAHRGFPERYFAINGLEWYKSGGALVKHVLETAEPILSSDIATDSRFPRKVHLEVGLLSCTFLPLQVTGDVRGIIHLAARAAGHFSDEQKDYLMAIARQMGIALENREILDKLLTSRNDLERAVKVRDEFLSVMSHELRTPLNIVTGYTGLVSDGMLGEINEDQKNALAKVMKQSEHLLRMLGSILQATQIGSGQVKINWGELDVGDFLDELKATYEVPLKKDISLNWDYDSHLPALKTDSEKLGQVLQNLIDNGIKFTEKGTVTISARLVEPDGHQWSPASSQQGSNGWIAFKVTDTGIGIPKESLPVIFNMFCQVDSSETRRFEGAGLGLYIARKYCELLGGTIEVESELGKGSTFTVTIPCVR